jgi:RNA polymerase sigma factor (sigma-70 family)
MSDQEPPDVDQLPAAPATDDQVAAALGELVENARTRLRSMFVKHDVSTADAEDILQDSLLIMYRKWPSIRDPESYFFGTVRRRIGHLYRRRRAAATLSLDEEQVAKLAPVASPQESSDRRQDARSLLARLNGRARRILQMRYVEQLSMREIAAALDESESGVRKTASRAVQRLRRYARALKLTDGEDPIR